MVQKTVAHFDIPYLQFIDSNGKATEELPAFAQDLEHLKKIYIAMVKNRVFDTKAITLQRTGKLGTYASTLAQEAIGIGIGAAMQETDVFCPYYREYGAQFWRGVKMLEILLYWGGDESGSNFEKARQDFPICVPIASQTLHAVGVATAIKLRHQPRAVVTVIGDGGTSRGDFYEAINLAGVWKLPIVFVINNNQWAISIPRSAQSAAETLAQKGIAGGVRSEQIDGNDVISVQYAVQTALERARKGEGPTVIEALTYRMSDHTTADDAKRYRDINEALEHEKEDPIARLAVYLKEKNVWDETKEKELQVEASQEVANIVNEYLQTAARKPETMFDHLYETLPEIYHSQREEVANLKEMPSHG